MYHEMDTSKSRNSWHPRITPPVSDALKSFRESSVRRHLDGELGLSTSAAGVCAVGVSGELDDLVWWQHQDILEFATNVLEDLLALLDRSALSASDIAITSAWNWLADSAGPDTNTVEALADVDNNAHNLSVVLILESLTDGSEHHVEPDIVNWDAALVLELVGPLATVLVLWILPLWLDALLEHVVVGLKSKVGGSCDVVLGNTLVVGKQ